MSNRGQRERKESIYARSAHYAYNAAIKTHRTSRAALEKLTRERAKIFQSVARVHVSASVIDTPITAIDAAASPGRNYFHLSLSPGDLRKKLCICVKMAPVIIRICVCVCGEFLKWNVPSGAAALECATRNAGYVRNSPSCSAGCN